MTIRTLSQANATLTPSQPRCGPPTQPPIKQPQAVKTANRNHLDRHDATCPLCGAAMLECRCDDVYDPVTLRSDYERRFHEKPDVIRLRLL